ncbi:hypothetical protein PROFUN_11597 [Planoprotostelium fungivorum]|uniref:Uncharacterized protein n=1 Tax=Planoprotostelium fungivorum TaxID=1890364 RepID=A0A2P6N9T8_9EUKA|nr:hypothetical protein PROFUN_11597 [Planoprotostelium fungivorum]
MINIISINSTTTFNPLTSITSTSKARDASSWLAISNGTPKKRLKNELNSSKETYKEFSYWLVVRR